jgi:hypothetical protein
MYFLPRQLYPYVVLNVVYGLFSFYDNIENPNAYR